MLSRLVKSERCFKRAIYAFLIRDELAVDVQPQVLCVHVTEDEGAGVFGVGIGGRRSLELRAEELVSACECRLDVPVVEGYRLEGVHVVVGKLAKSIGHFGVGFA